MEVFPPPHQNLPDLITNRQRILSPSPHFYPKSRIANPKSGGYAGNRVPTSCAGATVRSSVPYSGVGRYYPKEGFEATITIQRIVGVLEETVQVMKDNPLMNNDVEPPNPSGQSGSLSSVVLPAHVLSLSGNPVFPRPANDKALPTDSIFQEAASKPAFLVAHPIINGQKRGGFAQVAR